MSAAPLPPLPPPTDGLRDDFAPMPPRTDPNAPDLLAVRVQRLDRALRFLLAALQADGQINYTDARQIKGILRGETIKQPQP